MDESDGTTYIRLGNKFVEETDKSDKSDIEKYGSDFTTFLANDTKWTYYAKRDEWVKGDILGLQHISYGEGRTSVLDILDKMDKEDRKVLTRLVYYLYR